MAPACLHVARRHRPLAVARHHRRGRDTTLSVPSASGVLANDTDPNGLPLSAALVTQPSHNTGMIITQPDSYSTPHDQVLTTDASSGVLANDGDSDGDNLTASLVSQASHGNVTFHSDGSFSYMPNTGYAGTDSFTYTASDGVQTSNPTTVSLNVTDANAPTVIDHSYGIPKNTSENVTAASGLLQGASDADGDPLTASLVGNASHGTATVNPDGSFTYTPTTGYSGSDSFTYQASDGASSSNTATVSLTVHATDTAPTANAASYSVLHDQVLTEPAAQGVLSYASDADNDPLTASVVGGSGPSHGVLTLNADGSFTYTSTAGYTGTDSFQYTASDGLNPSVAATVTLTVTNAGLPVANADSYSVERNNEFDAGASTGVLANDSDSDGDTLTASVVSQPTHGSLTLNSDGSFSYIPTNNYTGTDTFTYTASDGVSTSSAATVTLTVTSSPPTASDQTLDVLQNTTLNALPGTLLLNAGNPDNLTLTAQDVTQAQDGTVTVNTDGSFAYTPTNGYTGTDSFTYDLADGSLTSSPATVSITVKASNTAPTATDLSYSVDENSSLSTDSSSGVLTGAADADGDTLFAALVSGPSNGTLTLGLDGSFSYTPNTNFSGTDSFQYKVFDGTTYSSAATVTLTVNEDVPTAVNDSYSVLSSGATSVTAANGVLANDSDLDGAALTAVLETQPSYGSVTLNSDGSFAYTPNGGFTGSDSFTYEAYNGANYSSAATVTLTSAPVAAAQSYGVNHDTPLTVDASSGLLTGASDADGDTLTAALAVGPSHGSVTVNSDGSFTYTPTTHYTGTDSFTFTASDGTQTSAPATATIDVTDSVPQANPQTWDTPQGTALTVAASNGVLASSSDDDGDSLTAQVASGPSNGTLQLNSDGSFTYTPNTGFFGTDSFTYDATDGISTSAAATVTISVNEVIPDNLPNSVPSAVATADFNNDGNPDVAMADKGLNTVSVYLDNSSGVVATTPISTTTVGSTPVALVAGDFGNGQQDLAVANSADNTVSILLGNGDGTFTAGTTLTGFNDPVALAVGDFNGDGKADLAVVNEASNAVSILLGNGNGTFGAPTSLTTGSSPTSIAAADFNNDGKLDLVVTNSASNTVSVFLGNDDGTFAPPLTDAVGTTPASVTTGDFDGDGNVDLVVANSGSNNVSVLLGNGDGSFQLASNYAVGSDPVSVVVGDFNGDGQTDLGVANKGSNNVSDLENVGNGTFLSATNVGAVSDPSSIAVADFNHDGFADQVVALADPGDEIIVGQADPVKRFVPNILTVSSGGTSIAAIDTTQNLVEVWNTATGQKYAILKPGKEMGAAKAIAFIPTKPQYLAIGEQGGVGIWNLDTGKLNQFLPFSKEKAAASSLTFSPDGKTLVAMYSSIVGVTAGDIWDIDPRIGQSLPHDGKVAPILSLPPWNGDKTIPCTQVVVTANQKGNLAITALQNGRLLQWAYTPNPRGYNLLPEVASFKPTGTTLAMSSPIDPKYLASAATADGSSSVYLYSSGETLLTANAQKTPPVLFLGFTSNTLLLRGDERGIIQYKITPKGGNTELVQDGFWTDKLNLKGKITSMGMYVAANDTENAYLAVGTDNGAVTLFNPFKLPAPAPNREVTIMR